MHNKLNYFLLKSIKYKIIPLNLSKLNGFLTYFLGAPLHFASSFLLATPGRAVRCIFYSAGFIKGCHFHPSRKTYRGEIILVCSIIGWIIILLMRYFLCQYDKAGTIIMIREFYSYELKTKNHEHQFVVFCIIFFTLS